MSKSRKRKAEVQTTKSVSHLNWCTLDYGQVDGYVPPGTDWRDIRIPPRRPYRYRSDKRVLRLRTGRLPGDPLRATTKGSK